jgi:flagellar FliL protein
MDSNCFGSAMAALDTDKDGKKKKGGLMVPLVIGVILALVAAGGGFWAVSQGPLAPEPPTATGQDTDHAASDTAQDMAPADVVFVSLDPVVITLGPEIAGRHLMFSAYLEVPPAHEAEVTHLVPRVLDVLNGYLRVIDLSELSEPTSLAVLRAQMLRRIQTVTGPGRVNDLLVTQFVVN